MIGSNRLVQVFAFPCPVDMRKWFDGLYALVAETLKADPLTGAYFLFVGKDRKRAKVLYWDGTGLCIFAKRLEKGRFAKLWREDTAGPISLSQSELALFIEGSEWVGRAPLSPPPLVLPRPDNPVTPNKGS